MKTKKAQILALLLSSLAASPITSLAFDSGSDGSYGNILLTNITTTPVTNTLTLPTDGIFRCGSIYIGTNCYLNFAANALNTPVYLLTESNIVVAGTIDVSGSDGVTNGSIVTTPGPGGFAGGAGGIPSAGVAAGGGQGPGAGLIGNGNVLGGGSFGSIGNGGTTNYGNLLLYPLIGGSGGSGFSGLANTYAGASGGAGGGAVLLASSTSVTITGKVIARGGNGVGQSTISSGYNSGGGAGGGVRVVAPTVLISGIFDVSGGTNSARISNFGGNGRVRIDATSTIVANVVGNGLAAAPVVSYGRSLFVFPSAAPSLYFLNAAGTSIPASTINGVAISLPSGSPTNQVVTLCATNFLGIVPVQVVATPAVGAPFVTNVVLYFSATNELVETNVTINVPPGTATSLNAFANYYVQP